MNDLLIGLLSTLLASNAPTAVSNLVRKTTGVAVTLTDPNDPVAVELKRLMAEDNGYNSKEDYRLLQFVILQFRNVKMI